MPNLSANMIYGLYTCRLLSSVLNDTEPVPLPEGMTLGGLYNYQKEQDVTNMAYVALRKLGFNAGELKEFQDDYRKQRKNGLIIYCELFLLGTTALLLITECRNKYSIIIVPFYLICCFGCKRFMGKSCSKK